MANNFSVLQSVIETCLDDLIKQAVVAERERCARIADDHNGAEAVRIAKAIRFTQNPIYWQTSSPPEPVVVGLKPCSVCGRPTGINAFAPDTADYVPYMGLSRDTFPSPGKPDLTVLAEEIRTRLGEKALEEIWIKAFTGNRERQDG